MSIDRRWKKECLPILIEILKLLTIKNTFADIRSRTYNNKDNGRNTMSIQHPLQILNYYNGTSHPLFEYLIETYNIVSCHPTSHEFNS